MGDAEWEPKEEVFGEASGRQLWGTGVRTSENTN